MFEVLNFYREKIDASAVLERLKLQVGKYFVVSAHREKNIDSPWQLAGLVNILNSLASDHNCPVIVSTHPRTRRRFEAEGVVVDPRVVLLRPPGFFDYNHLQSHARIVLSDSETIAEESSMLNFPALNLRKARERPEAMEEGTVIMVGMDYSAVKVAVGVLDRQGRGAQRTLRPVADYQMPNVLEKVLRLIISYTKCVHHTVWRRTDI